MSQSSGVMEQRLAAVRAVRDNKARMVHEGTWSIDDDVPIMARVFESIRQTLCWVEWKDGQTVVTHLGESALQRAGK